MKKILAMILALAAGMMLDAGSARGQAATQQGGASTGQQPGASAGQQPGATQGGETEQRRGIRGSMENRMDRMFVDKAAKDGMWEVQLSQLALQKATSEDVKRVAKMMIDDHTKANNQLMELAKQQAVPLSTQEAVEDNQKRLNKFTRMEGAEFEREYMAQLVKDHQKDIKLFEKHAKNSQNEAFKTFAQQQLPVLRHHLEVVQKAQSSMEGGQQGSQGGAGSTHQHQSEGGASTR